MTPTLSLSEARAHAGARAHTDSHKGVRALDARAWICVEALAHRFVHTHSQIIALAPSQGHARIRSWSGTRAHTPMH
eukprot:6186071-Pleurochrysis_carterae.AAC.1